MVFGLFNGIDNKIDLTDQGRLNARKKRRESRLLNGESPIEKVMSSIGIKERDDDDDDIQIIGKKGGGCG